jgi:hypothetical protein
MSKDEELSTSAAARKYLTHVNHLNRLLLARRLAGRKNAAGNWLISKKSLDEWQARRKKPKVSQGESLVRVLSGR